MGLCCHDGRPRLNLRARMSSCALMHVQGVEAILAWNLELGTEALQLCLTAMRRLAVLRGDSDRSDRNGGGGGAVRGGQALLAGGGADESVNKGRAVPMDQGSGSQQGCGIYFCTEDDHLASSLGGVHTAGGGGAWWPFSRRQPAASPALMGATRGSGSGSNRGGKAAAGDLLTANDAAAATANGGGAGGGGAAAGGFMATGRMVAVAEDASALVGWAADVLSAVPRLPWREELLEHHYCAEVAAVVSRSGGSGGSAGSAGTTAAAGGGAGGRITSAGHGAHPASGNGAGVGSGGATTAATIAGLAASVSLAGRAASCASSPPGSPRPSGFTLHASGMSMCDTGPRSAAAAHGNSQALLEIEPYTSGGGGGGASAAFAAGSHSPVAPAPTSSRAGGGGLLAGARARLGLSSPRAPRGLLTPGVSIALPEDAALSDALASSFLASGLATAKAVLAAPPPPQPSAGSMRSPRLWGPHVLHSPGGRIPHKVSAGSSGAVSGGGAATATAHNRTSMDLTPNARGNSTSTGFGVGTVSGPLPQRALRPSSAHCPRPAAVDSALSAAVAAAAASGSAAAASGSAAAASGTAAAGLGAAVPGALPQHNAGVSGPLGGSGSLMHAAIAEAVSIAAASAGGRGGGASPGLDREDSWSNSLIEHIGDDAETIDEEDLDADGDAVHEVVASSMDGGSGGSGRGGRAASGAPSRSLSHLGGAAAATRRASSQGLVVSYPRAPRHSPPHSRSSFVALLPLAPPADAASRRTAPGFAAAAGAVGACGGSVDATASIATVEEGEAYTAPLHLPSAAAAAAGVGRSLLSPHAHRGVASRPPSSALRTSARFYRSSTTGLVGGGSSRGVVGGVGGGGSPGSVTFGTYRTAGSKMHSDGHSSAAGADAVGAIARSATATTNSGGGGGGRVLVTSVRQAAARAPAVSLSPPRAGASRGADAASAAASSLLQQRTRPKSSTAVPHAASAVVSAARPPLRHSRTGLPTEMPCADVVDEEEELRGAAPGTAPVGSTAILAAVGGSIRVSECGGVAAMAAATTTATHAASRGAGGVTIARGGLLSAAVRAASGALARFHRVSTPVEVSGGGAVTACASLALDTMDDAADLELPELAASATVAAPPAGGGGSGGAAGGAAGGWGAQLVPPELVVLFRGLRLRISLDVGSLQVPCGDAG
mgnify:CR=1 FL=1